MVVKRAKYIYGNIVLYIATKVDVAMSGRHDGATHFMPITGFFCVLQVFLWFLFSLKYT